MKVFKIISTIVLSLVFIISLSFTILLSSSSNASLLFKHSDEKMLAIASSQRLAFEPSYLLNEHKKNISIKEENDEGSIYYNFNFDKDGNAIIKIKKENETSYYKDSTLYQNINGNKTKQLDVTISDLCDSFLTKLNLFQDLVIEDIPVSKTKSKTYIKLFDLGIKYTIKEEDRTITYIYSLKGKLKEIRVSSSNSNLKYEIDYNSNNISLPNLNEYQAA